MAGRRIVLDASVVVKWFHDEENTDRALNLQESISTGELSAAVPDLLFYEVSNVLVRAIGKSAPEMTEAVRVLADMPWDVVSPSSMLLEDSIALAANRPPLTVYDAAYAALALRRDAELVTADKKLNDLIGPPITRLL
jgi:predicted nucleic acid-binding protein